MSARLLTLLLAVSACGPGGRGDGVAASFESATGGPPQLAVLRAGEAIGYTGPDDEPFAVRLRTPDLRHYPCSGCHTEAVVPGGRGTEEHADVRPEHPAELTEQCTTCHAASNPAELTLHTGESASLDAAYRLCAQCHFAQADDWAGGAHGKRLVGWRGRRVVMSCTECHDPHAPTFAQRIPIKGPRIPRTGSSTR